MFQKLHTHSKSNQAKHSTLYDKNEREDVKIIPRVPFSAGGYHTVAITKNGALYTWGKNFHGQLGLGDNGFGTKRKTPTQVETATHWKRVYARKNSTAAITTDDELFIWGDNAYGQLGY